MSRPGLAAWIVEKFHGWSDNDGDVESAFTKDEMLTNITLYWVTETITSSSHIYYESGHAPPTRPVGYIDVPTGVAIFPKEITFRTAKVGRGMVQHRSMDGHATRGALRGAGGARTVGGRHPCVLQAAEVEGLAVARKSI